MKPSILAILPFLLIGWNTADAVPTLGDILGDATYAGVMDNGDETFAISDVDGIDDDITGLLILELAGFAGVNTSFIYDLDDPTNRVTVFDGAATVFDSAVLTYNTLTSEWDNGGAPVMFSSGEEFGIGLTNPSGDYFSESTLNGGVDHLLVFDTEGLPGLVGAFQKVFAFEDLPGGGDGDFNDHVFAGTDIIEAQQVLPSPGPLALLGLGLLALSLRGRQGR